MLCALNVPFWGVYEQQGNSLQFWADESTDLHVLRVARQRLGDARLLVPVGQPGFIFLLTPFINPLWLRRLREDEPSSVTKMAIGCFLLGISFLVMIGAARGSTPGRRRASRGSSAARSC